MSAIYKRDGVIIFPVSSETLEWSGAAHRAAREVVKAPGDMRHGQTWRVGVDELPNHPDGSVGSVALRGAWEDLIQGDLDWHPAQLSVVYPNYPQQDAGDSDAAHGYRLRRDAAHVDGLLPEGPNKRRYLKEPHAFILGLALNKSDASPLVVWPGSHLLMQSTFGKVLADHSARAWSEIDLTDAYQAARRSVFETCKRVEVPILPGQAVLLHRHLLHGVAPWGDGDAPPEGRMIAYFRPVLHDIADWL